MKLDNQLYSQCDVFSFDLFDTVLFRHVKRPAHLFYFVGLEAQTHTGISPPRFQKYRMLAEKLCRLQVRLLTTREETNLSEIYQMLGHLLPLDAATLTYLMQEEMRQEKKLIYPNPEAVAIVQSISQQGKKVVFTSDMYLPFEFLYGLLDEIGIIQSEDQLYLSSAVGKRKKSGNLFKYVVGHENKIPKKIFHIGDNFGHDYQVPSRLGLNSVHYRRKVPKITWLKPVKNEDVAAGLVREVSNLTYLGKGRFTNGFETQNLSAACQNVGHDEEISPVGILGAYVGGPVLFAYVHWLLHQAASKQIKTLCFLARDGQILMRLAELIQARCDLDIELKYVYASRHAWLLPSVEDYGRISEESKFFVFSKKLTLEKLIYRFKLENSDPAWLAAKVQQSELRPDEPITLLNFKKAKKFFQDDEIIDQVREIGTREFNTFSGYLQQEGLFDATAYGLVDVGWRGSLPRALRKTLQKNGVDAAGFTVFYFDLRGSAPDNQDQYTAFLKAVGNQYSAIRGEVETVMEILTAATHESTYGYEEVDGRFEPVFIKEDMNLVKEWGLEAMQNVMLDFAHNMLANPCFEEIPTGQVYEACIQNFYDFLAKPSQEIVEKLIEFPYTVQQIKTKDEAYETICAPYSMRDFVTLLRNFNVVRSNDLWIQGSLSLTKNRLARSLFGAFYKFISSDPLQKFEYMVRAAATK